ncbi:MAG TPA: HEAT repeat domain-containing protein [Gemmataceae bacterium]|jgi:HEAT repeat protein
MTNKLVLAAVFFLTLLLPCRAAEPLYAGKPLAFWLDELKSDDPLIREEALAVLSDAGAAARAATPTILKLTRHSDAPLRAASLSALRFLADPKEARQAALQSLKDDAPLVRCRAVVLLAHVDAKHPDVLPHVLELLKQPVGRDELLSLLGRMGPQAERAVPTLTKLLDEADPPSRRSAIQALRQIGPGARPAVPALLEQLHAADLITRLEAVQALRAIGGDRSRIVAAVLEAAKQDTAARSAYLSLLADYGAEAAPAVPWLVAELHRQPQLFVTVQIAEMLYKIDRERARKEARPVLQKMLQPNNPWRIEAAAALRRAEPDNEEALQTLLDCMAASQIAVRLSACYKLGTLGKSADKAIPGLRKAVRDSDLSLRVTAAFALWQITGETDSTAPVLLEALKPSQAIYWRSQAASHLGQMGASVNKSVLPELRKFRDDAVPAVRDSVRRAIEQIESSAQKAKSP